VETEPARVLAFISERVAQPVVRVVPKENSEGHLNHHKQVKYLFLKYAQEGCDTIFVRGADFLHFLFSELETSNLFDL
jgi:hypothetical protein